MSARVVGVMALAASALGAACASARGGAADSTSVAGGDTSLVVSLDRGACHGSCPIYTVAVQSQGRVRFTGTRFVRPIGTDSSTITSAAVRALRASFTARRFTTFPSRIEYNSPTCGAYVADLPTVELRVVDSAGAHVVRWDEGCRDHPRTLDTLARMVDSVTGTTRWTTAPRP